MPNVNLDIIPLSSYLNELKVNGTRQATLEYYTSILKDAHSFKTLPEWNREDVNAYFLSLSSKNKKSSIEVKKLVLKKYLNWAGKHDAVAHLKARMPKGDLKREDMLTVEDIDKLIASTESPLWKALIAFLFESGCRIGEATTLKVKDIQETDKGLIVNISTTKTDAGIRKGLLIYSAGYIRNHISYSALKKDDILFKISKAWAWIMLNRFAKEAGITKPMSPHKFRHASATYACLKGYNEDIIRKKFGWSASSDVPARYKHLIDEDVIDATLEKEGNGDIPKPKSITNIKQADPLNIVDASMQLSKLSDENEALKAEMDAMKQSTVHENEALRAEVSDMKENLMPLMAEMMQRLQTLNANEKNI